MKRVTAFLAVLALVLLGFLAGVLGTHLFYAKRLQRAGSFSVIASEFFAERLDRELGLSAEQRTAIDEILDETRIEADELRRALRPKIGGLMEAASERIMEVLSSEQRQLFSELRERHRARADHFLLGPPGPRGPRGPGGPPRRGPRRGLRPEPPPSVPEAPEAPQQPEPEATPPDA